MEQYVVTKEQLLGARTYLPLEEKTAFLERADRCFDRMSVTLGDEAMPPMFKENCALKTRYLAAALAVYLRIPYDSEEDDAMLMSEADCDKLGESHVVMQIERFKRDKDEVVRNAAYDLLSDYFRLEKAFDAEIKALLAVQNDTVIRQSQMNQAAMAELPALLEQFKSLQETKGEG